MAWHVGAVGNGIIMGAYFLIGATILHGLRRTGQLRTNRLGLATAAIFVSCGAGHAFHLLHLVAPWGTAHGDHALHGVQAAARIAYPWHMAGVDVVTAVVAITYWRLRGQYRVVLEGPSLFADLKARQRRALEINDNIVQGLVVARYALDAGPYRGSVGSGRRHARGRERPHVKIAGRRRRGQARGAGRPRPQLTLSRPTWRHSLTRRRHGARGSLAFRPDNRSSGDEAELVTKRSTPCDD